MLSFGQLLKGSNVYYTQKPVFFHLRSYLLKRHPTCFYSPGPSGTYHDIEAATVISGGPTILDQAAKNLPYLPLVTSIFAPGNSKFFE